MGRLRQKEFTVEELEAMIRCSQKQYVSYEEGAKLYSLGRNSFIELARYQKQFLPKVAGDEDIVLSAAQMYHDEINRNPRWAKYIERTQVEVSSQIKKMLSIGMHDFIWKLH